MRKWLVALFVAHWVVDAAVVLGIALAALLVEPEPVPVIRLDPIVVDAPPSRLVALAERVGGNMEIAEAIAREADRSGLDDDLIVGVIMVENPWLDPGIENWYGAIGLMQVVGRLHLGDHPECGTDLTDIATNVCYGVSILERKLVAAEGDLTLALLFYNGCWGSTYKAGCESYPVLVAERGDD